MKKIEQKGKCVKSAGERQSRAHTSEKKKKKKKIEEWMNENDGKKWKILNKMIKEIIQCWMLNVEMMLNDETD